MEGLLAKLGEHFVYIIVSQQISGGRPRLRMCARLVRQGIVKYLPNGNGFGGTFGGTFGIERYSELNFLRREANDMHPYDHRIS